MDFEKFTDRARGFIQSAQTLALRSGHQQLVALHLAKCLLDDKQGAAANLITAAGGDAGKALENTGAELAKLPVGEGSGADQVHLAGETARLFDQAEQIAEKSGASFVTTEILLLAIVLAEGTAAAKAMKGAYVTGQTVTVDGGKELWGDYWPIPDPPDLAKIEIPCGFAEIQP